MFFKVNGDDIIFSETEAEGYEQLADDSDLNGCHFIGKTLLFPAGCHVSGLVCVRCKINARGGVRGMSNVSLDRCVIIQLRVAGNIADCKLSNCAGDLHVAGAATDCHLYDTLVYIKGGVAGCSITSSLDGAYSRITGVVTRSRLANIVVTDSEVRSTSFAGLTAFEGNCRYVGETLEFLQSVSDITMFSGRLDFVDSEDMSKTKYLLPVGFFSFKHVGRIDREALSVVLMSNTATDGQHVLLCEQYILAGCFVGTLEEFWHESIEVHNRWHATTYELNINHHRAVLTNFYSARSDYMPTVCFMSATPLKARLA